MITQSDRQKKEVKQARKELGNIYIDKDFIEFIKNNLQ
mgnify:CR=1 FL=1